MSDMANLFLNSVFSENLVFITFFGTLLLFIEAKGARKSFTKSLKFTAIFFGVILVGWAVRGWLNGSENVILFVFFFTSLMGAFSLRSWGELNGDWMGIPRFIVVLAPFMGIQWLLYEQGIAYFDTIYAILGSVVGFYVAFVLIAAVREQLKISEIPDFLNRQAILLITMAFFAVALIGFAFI